MLSEHWGKRGKRTDTTGTNDFNLISEGRSVTYCTLHWEPREKLLSYQVVANIDTHEGEKGSIQF